MTSRRLMYTLGVIGTLVFYIAYQKWLSWILLWVVLCFPWLSLCLSFGAMYSFRLEPDGATRIPLRTPEHIQIKPKTRSPIPPHQCRVRIQRPITGERWNLKPGDPLPTDHCGGLIVSLQKAKVYDYLGLFCRRIRNADPKTFLILPEPIAMELPSDLKEYLSRSWRPKPGGGYSEHHEIRPYHPGDNLNQIHWKLSAKVGELMLREPMEPERGLILITMDLKGSGAELDQKFGHLLWLSNWLLEQSVSFEIRVLTGMGIENWTVTGVDGLNQSMNDLLCRPFAATGSIRDRNFSAAWQCHIGGEAYET